MPDDLRDLLTERARLNGRSLNAEIIGILQHAISAGQQPLTGLDVSALADAVAERVAAKLRDA